MRDQPSPAVPHEGGWAPLPACATAAVCQSLRCLGLWDVSFPPPPSELKKNTKTHTHKTQNYTFKE